MVEVAATKYWVKWDEEKNGKISSRLNITRMFEELLKNKRAPDEIKIELARDMNNAAAKKFLAHCEAKHQKRQNADQSQLVKEECELQEKRSKACTGAKGREQERQLSITRFVNLDPPLPTAQLELCLYLLSVALVMCRLPFAIVTNRYFRSFVKALRPKFDLALGGGRLQPVCGVCSASARRRRNGTNYA